jgi:poly(A) polymerase
MTTLLPAHKIKPPLWMQDPDLILVLDTLNQDDINARMVGGCIRNQYMNKTIYDIDIACKYNPEKSITVLKNNNIKTIPTGIKHGTITAHINGKNFEITTLRTDTKTDGRHAEIEFSDDWVKDAERRDFTINALYLGQALMTFKKNKFTLSVTPNNV